MKNVRQIPTIHHHRKQNNGAPFISHKIQAKKEKKNVGKFEVKNKKLHRFLPSVSKIQTERILNKTEIKEKNILTHLDRPKQG